MNTVIARPDMRMVDVWSVKKFDRPEIMGAYRKLMDTHVIELIKVYISKGSGIVAVDYLSSLPYVWTMDALRDAKNEILKEAAGGGD